MCLHVLVHTSVCVCSCACVCVSKGMYAVHCHFPYCFLTHMHVISSILLFIQVHMPIQVNVASMCTLCECKLQIMLTITSTILTFP